VTTSPGQPYRPRWWQVWLLPFAAPLGIGLVLLAGLVVWWTAMGGRRDVQRAGQGVGHAISGATYQAMLEGQRIEGVDTGPATHLPVLWEGRLVGHTKGLLRIGPRPGDTSAGAVARWVQAESLASTNLGAGTSIIGSVMLSDATDSNQRHGGLADLLARPTASVIYAGELESTVDTAALADLVAVLEPAAGAAGGGAVRLYPEKPTTGEPRGQLWLGPGPVIVPLQ
jgi:hypothetical protein